MARNTSALNAFIASLPLSIQFCGWSVTFTRRQDSTLGLKIIGEADTGWGMRAQRNELKPFLQYLLKLPTGQQLLTFGRVKWINDRRIIALARCFDAWRRLIASPPAGDRLAEAIQCIAYVESGEAAGFNPCENRTKNKNGLCRFHSKADTKHLWNYEPFSAYDAMADRFEALGYPPHPPD